MHGDPHYAGQHDTSRFCRRARSYLHVHFELLLTMTILIVSIVMCEPVMKVTDGLTGDIDVSLIEEAVKLVGGRVETEASGNVTLDTVCSIAATGVSFISCGALTHSVHALDISLNIETSRPKTF